jgi:uncharacterized protein YwqG
MEKRFQKLMQKAGLAKYTDDILKLAWNSIRIRTEAVDDAELPLGDSKIGGEPDLPKCCEWPTYKHNISLMLELDKNTAKAEEISADTTQTDKSDEEILRDFEAFIEDFNKKRQAEWKANPVERPAKPARKPVIATTPLSFLAQFKMADLAPYDTEGLLPRTGLLYFFYDAICQPGGCGPSNPKGHRVIYYNGNPKQLKRTPFPDDLRTYARFQSLRVSFSRELTLPSNESVFIRTVGFTRDDESNYCRSVYEPCCHVCPDEDSDMSVHRMLGHPDPDQNDVFLDCEKNRGSKTGYNNPRTWKNAADWRLLFQLASISRDKMQPEMMWGDLGHLYFCIKKDDLAAKDFRNIWLEHQCG